MIFVPSGTLVPDRQLTFDSYLRLQYLMARNVSPNERYIQSLSSLEAVESGGGGEEACGNDFGYPTRGGGRPPIGVWRGAAAAPARPPRAGRNRAPAAPTRLRTG